MFPVIPYNEEMRQDYCRNTWDVTIRTEWPAISFWGKDIKSTSNIIFSNGVTYTTLNFYNTLNFLLMIMILIF